MKKSILILVGLITILSCSKEEELVSIKESEEKQQVVVKKNSAPEVNLLTPKKDAKLPLNTASCLLEWEGKDADNDSLSYELFFGESLSSTPIVTQSSTKYKVENLIAGKTYKWKVVVSDGKLKTNSEVFTFKIPKPVVKGVFIEWQNIGVAYDIYGREVRFQKNSLKYKIDKLFI